jgi:16S rRNA (guanine527-N7)-methyltransferase
MVDSVRKKVSFLKHVIRLLGVKNTRAIHMRVEDLGGDPVVAAFDTIVCRAFGSLKYIAECALPLMSGKGQILVWKGHLPEEELEELRPVIDCAANGPWLRVETYQLPVVEAQRTLVIIGTQPRILTP